MEPPVIYTTVQWEARPARHSFTTQPPVGIVVHNTATPNRPPEEDDAEIAAAFRLARSIQNYHLDHNDWSDTGQNFTVSRGGILMEGRHGSLAAAQRALVVRGAHAGTNEGNIHWFGIEVEGDNVDAFLVTDAQWASLIELCAWLSYWGDFDSTSIRGHMEFVATDCPGTIMDHLEDLRSAVHARKAQIAEANG